MDVSPAGREALRRMALAALAVPLGLFVLGSLATMMGPSAGQRMGVTVCDKKVDHDLTAIEGALKEYAIDHDGRYPLDLEAIVTPDADGYTYLDRRTVPLDPWKRPYIYGPPGPNRSEPRIYTYGSDGVPGGEGDAADVDNQSVKRER